MTWLFRAFEALLFSNSAAARADDDGEKGPPARETPQNTVLVIDDDRAFLDVMRASLRDAGFNVLTSPSGPKGLDMLRYAQRDIHAVVLDYNLPGFNGAETLGFVRKLSPTVKVIAISGFDATRLPPGFQEGVDAFLAKPFAGSELVSLLRAMTNHATPVAATSPS